MFCQSTGRDPYTTASGAASLRRRRRDAKNQIDVLSARLTRKLYTENKEKAEGGITVHGMHCRETETGSPQCTGSPPSRKIEKFGLGWFNSPCASRASSSDFRRVRARTQCPLRPLRFK